MVKSSFQDKTSKNEAEGNDSSTGSFEEYWDYHKAIWDKDDNARDSDRDHDHPFL